MNPVDPGPHPASGSEFSSRRRFFSAVFWGAASGLAGFFTAAAAAVLLRHPAGPSDSAQEPDDLGSLSDYPEEIPVARMLSFSAARADPYSRPRRVYVIRKGDSAVVLSSVCTHLECHVEWEGLDRRFHCPCHGGTFDLTGSAVGGPPRDPLRKLQTHVVAGRLQVRPA